MAPQGPHASASTAKAIKIANNLLRFIGFSFIVFFRRDS
jgi:hypothetical protein